jgi:hypothetical protein
VSKIRHLYSTNSSPLVTLPSLQSKVGTGIVGMTVRASVRRLVRGAFDLINGHALKNFPQIM